MQGPAKISLTTAGLTVKKDRSWETDWIHQFGLYSSNQFRECSNVLKDVCREFPGNRVAKTELARSTSRLLEQSRGFYNFRLMHQEAAELRPPCLDHTNYIGPVEVRQTKSMGRGMFTTGAVSSGDFLICEKAFGYTFSENAKDLGLATSAALIYSIIQRLSRTPDIIPTFTNISHGTHEPAVGHGGKLIVDPYVVSASS